MYLSVGGSVVRARIVSCRPACRLLHHLSSSHLISRPDCALGIPTLGTSRYRPRCAFGPSLARQTPSSCPRSLAGSSAKRRFAPHPHPHRPGRLRQHERDSLPICPASDWHSALRSATPGPPSLSRIIIIIFFFSSHPILSTRTSPSFLHSPPRPSRLRTPRRHVLTDSLR